MPHLPTRNSAAVTMAPGITSGQEILALGSSLKITANSATTTEKENSVDTQSSTVAKVEAIHMSPYNFLAAPSTAFTVSDTSRNSASTNTRPNDSMRLRTMPWMPPFWLADTSHKSSRLAFSSANAVVALKISTKIEISAAIHPPPDSWALANTV